MSTLSRREFLRYLGEGASLVAAGGVLAACAPQPQQLTSEQLSAVKTLAAPSPTADAQATKIAELQAQIDNLKKGAAPSNINPTLDNRPAVAAATRLNLPSNTPTATVTTLEKMNIDCATVKQGGPVKVSTALPEVPISQLVAKWPNAKMQNFEASNLHSLVVQEPGTIKFPASDKDKPDMKKVIDDGYAFVFDPDNNQWALGTSDVNVHVESNVTSLMGSWGEAALTLGPRTYIFPQEDKNGGTEYLVYASLKGDRLSVSNVKAQCLVPNHWQLDTFPNGRPDVPVSSEFAAQNIQNSLKRAARVVFTTIDPSREVMTVSEHFRDGRTNLLYTNVNVNK